MKLILGFTGLFQGMYYFEQKMGLAILALLSLF